MKIKKKTAFLFGLSAFICFDLEQKYCFEHFFYPIHHFCFAWHLPNLSENILLPASALLIACLTACAFSLLIVFSLKKITNA